VFWGLSNREWLLVVFIFGLVYGAAWIPRIGARLGRLYGSLFGKRDS
jgi:Sec-independent protein translocase protein TatA